MESSFFIIKNYTNEQLRSLVREMHVINSLIDPANAELSPNMRMLFDSESTYGLWADCYHRVNISIDWEIKRRIINNTF